MRTACPIAVVWLLVQLTGCEAKKATTPADEVTLVVKADNQQLVAEKAALSEQQKLLNENRMRLEKENQSPNCAAWPKLFANLDDMDKKQEAIIRRQEETIGRLMQLARSGAPATTPALPSAASLEARERALAQREKNLAERQALAVQGLKSLEEQQQLSAQRDQALSDRQNDAGCEQLPKKTPP